MQELDIFESCRAVYTRVSADGKNFECISEPELQLPGRSGMSCVAGRMQKRWPSAVVKSAKREMSITAFRGGKHIIIPDTAVLVQTVPANH